MALRNIPTTFAANMSSMITCRAGQVSSMSLTTRGGGCEMTLFAFSDGESVSEETYGSDMLYYGVEGSFEIVMADTRIPVSAGEVLGVPAGTMHAVEGKGEFKVLQIAAG